MSVDGMRIVVPGGNSTTSLRSLSTKWPPTLGSKEQMGVMVHQDCARLAMSTWG